MERLLLEGMKESRGESETRRSLLEADCIYRISDLAACRWVGDEITL